MSVFQLYTECRAGSEFHAAEPP